MAFLSRNASSALKPRRRGETYCRLALGYIPPFSAGGRKPMAAVVFCEDQSVLAPTAKSTCCATTNRTGASSAHAKTARPNLLIHPPESGILRLSGNRTDAWERANLLPHRSPNTGHSATV